MTTGDDSPPPVKPEKEFPEIRSDADAHAELPDYEEDQIVPEADSQGWLSNPKNWTKLFVCLLLFLGILLAAPFYRYLKNWRADTFLENSAVAFAYGDREHGVSLMKEAIAISPGGEDVQKALELYNARAGDTASLAKLLSRMKAGKSSKDEILGIAEVEMKAGNRESVREVIARLPKNLNHHQELRLTLIRAMMMELEEGPDQAASLCLAGARDMKGEDADRLQNQAALYLLADRNGTRKRDGVDILLGVMREKSGASLAAARILARLTLYSDGKSAVLLTPAEAGEVAHLLPTFAGNQPGDALLAADLEIHADPSCRDAVVKRLTSYYQTAPRSQMLDFGRWLNAQGLHEQVIAFAGAERPRSDTDWLLIVLDAQCATGDWKGVSEMLNTPAGLGIPDAVKHLFLARVAMMVGDKASAEEEWRSVNGSLHLEKPETLAYIAGYEEQIGALDQASLTYREMADRQETRLPGLIGLIRTQPRAADVATLIPLYENLLAVAPDFSDAEGDLAYLKLLANRDTKNASGIAEKLLTAQPNSLARISIAALGRLRNGDLKGARSLYETNKIDWGTSPASWKAVRFAVLRASGEAAAADQLAGSLVVESLNPQEKELLSYPLPGVNQ